MGGKALGESLGQRRRKGNIWGRKRRQWVDPISQLLLHQLKARTLLMLFAFRDYLYNLDSNKADSAPGKETNDFAFDAALGMPMKISRWKWQFLFSQFAGLFCGL
jgi:hypothetical protein